MSEIAKLKAEIELEIASMQMVKNAPSIGISRHKVISMKMSRVGVLHDKLKKDIGEESSSLFLVKTMNRY